MELKYDREYFKDRGLEPKHWLFVAQWIKEFEPETVFDYGCGKGPFVHCFNYFNIDCEGYDISKDAVNEPILLAKDKITCIKTDCFIGKKNKIYDLIICIDLLEHLTEEEIDEVLSDCRDLAAKDILFSICFKDDPNFKLDKTHITEKTREWWEYKLRNKGFIIKEVPEHFHYKQQMILAEVKEDEEYKRT